jgi:hypothetical protein
MSLTSCKGSDFKIEFLFEKDGCKMYRFKDRGRLFYAQAVQVVMILGKEKNN